MGYTTVTFGGLTINAKRLSISLRPATYKMKIGNNLSIVKRIGGSKEKYIVIEGDIYGANKDTERTTLIGLDDALNHTYVDGLHDGNYILVPGSLKFSDDAQRNPTHYEYTVELIEYNQ